MEEPLAQFLVWWDSPDGKQRAVDEQESVYRIAQRAFFAGHATQPPVPLAPSRDALTAPRVGPHVGRFQVAGPAMDLKPVARPYFEHREGDVVRFLEPLPAPDYVAGPSIQTMERIYGGLQARMDAGEPLPRPAPPPFVHTQTLWQAPESPDTLQFRAIEPDEDEYGPRGPVFTPLSGQDG